MRILKRMKKIMSVNVQAINEYFENLTRIHYNKIRSTYFGGRNDDKSR